MEFPSGGGEAENGFRNVSFVEVLIVMRGKQSEVLFS